MLLRSAFFLVPGSAIWALLPLVATQRLHMSASGYGLLLGALGVGAVAGSFAIRAAQGATLRRTCCCCVQRCLCGSDGRGRARSQRLRGGGRIAAGRPSPGLTVLSTMNASLQLFLPQWVRARGLSVYLTVLFGSQAVGAVVWGVVAAPKGVLSRLPHRGGADGCRRRNHPDLAAHRHRRHGPANGRAIGAASLRSTPCPTQGPVVVRCTTRSHRNATLPFWRRWSASASPGSAPARPSGGCSAYGETPHDFVELFVVASWDEHLRQHTDRLDRYRRGSISITRARCPTPSHAPRTCMAAELPD